MNTKRTKRYFGMTVVQLAILGCLALVACGTVAGGLMFASSSTGGGGISLFPSPVPSPTPQPTSTPFLTETPAPTPTETLIPYEELIPSGWNQYATTSIELWLPPQFEAVDVEKKRQESIEFYKNSGYEDKARELEESPSAFVFWFETSEMGTTLYRTNVTIESSLMTAASLDDLLEQESTSDFPQYVVVNRQEFQVGNYEARRILTEVNFNNVYLGIAQYAIFDGINVWLITCGSHFNEFYAWLPEFDKIARTFRLVGQ